MTHKNKAEAEYAMHETEALAIREHDIASAAWEDRLTVTSKRHRDRAKALEAEAARIRALLPTLPD